MGEILVRSAHSAFIVPRQRAAPLHGKLGADEQMSRESCSFTAVARGQPALLGLSLQRLNWRQDNCCAHLKLELAGASGEGMGCSLNGTTASTGWAEPWARGWAGGG